MKYKDISKDWKIAGIYFLLYTIISVLIGTAYTLIVVHGVSALRLNVPSLIGGIASILFPLTLIWIGTKFSSLYITKKFTLEKINSIVKWATGYYIALDLVFLLRDFLITDINGIPIVRNYPLNIATTLISTFVFYYLTMRYLREAKQRAQADNNS